MSHWHMTSLEAKKRHLSSADAQSLLKEEIILLQKELDGQTVLRSALEKALHCQPLCDDPTYKSLSQPAEDLINEISLLEMEVVHLEKYLLSMYRRNFAKRSPSLPTKIDAETPSAQVATTSSESLTKDSATRPRNDSDNALLDTGIYRTHSSLSHSACSFRASPHGEALDPYHSMPLSMLEYAQESKGEANLGEEIGPNLLSEEMIKCISNIYCHISDPPLNSQGFGSFSLSSPQAQFSPSKELSGSFYTMVQVCSIVRDSQRLNSVQELLLKYKSIIAKLAQIDPGKLTHEEKLAFWINVHNALVMHAFMVYGTPRGSLKRISIVLKAAYNVGGHTVSVDTIQSSILRCRLPRPSQWLHSLFFPKAKFKDADPRKAYAVKHAEPRLHFTLCSGCRSDPPVRLYTPKKVFQDLEMAKEEYIQMNMKLHKEQRLVLPKNVECFTKEMGLSPLGIAEMLEQSMPQSCHHHQQGKLWKKVEWIPHNFSFAFLLSNELIR